jgi:pyrroline-5-carboxylate reductase
MTQAGLDVLDADGVLIQLLTDTLRAARDRGAELAAAAGD